MPRIQVLFLIVLKTEVFRHCRCALMNPGCNSLAGLILVPSSQLHTFSLCVLISTNSILYFSPMYNLFVRFPLVGNACYLVATCPMPEVAFQRVFNRFFLCHTFSLCVLISTNSSVLALLLCLDESWV